MSSASLADIGLAPALLRAVEKKARRAGTTPQEYVRALIERDVLADRSFDEILRPVRADVRAGGLTAEQLDGLVERARNERASNERARNGTRPRVRKAGKARR